MVVETCSKVATGPESPSVVTIGAVVAAHSAQAASITDAKMRAAYRDS